MRLPFPHEKPGRLLPKIVHDCDLQLREKCTELIGDVKEGRRLAPAAAWVIDNYAFLHAQLREVKEAIPPGYEKHLARLSGGLIWGQPRMYLAAFDAIGHAEGELTQDSICEFLAAYQQGAPLRMAELWAFGPLLKLALVQKICLALLQEPLDSKRCEAAVQTSVRSLRSLETTVWSEVVEATSAVDHILREDPAAIYAGMSRRTRDAYRHSVEGIAKKTKRQETEVARMAVELAATANEGAVPARRHVGYYLAGRGEALLKAQAGYEAGVRERFWAWVNRHPNVVYLGTLAIFTAAVCAAAMRFLGDPPWWVAALLILPASQTAQALTNLLLNSLIGPRTLPRMDFSEGIPASCRTLVAVPTLLISRDEVSRLLERLEIHYLANRDPNLLFALVTDHPDSAKPEGDAAVLRFCRDGIRKLNQRHKERGRSPFLLLHRPLRWNASEGVWMGQERKRGKLNDLNAFILGETDEFETKEGDAGALASVRYVITLDSDTQLPRDAAREMVAAMAHPLNHPVLDPNTNTVAEGYGLLQPRVTVSVESAARSRLASLYSGQTGFDPYTTAVSDVYQDLYGRASFTGKGIYDVAVFHQTAGRRFPDNTLLSHDLIEGEHLRVGLLTDVEVIDDFPSTYQSYSKRKHRWTRGDWQIIEWLGRRVRNARGVRAPNPLKLVSRWKILDNLRRSLLEISFVTFLLGAWAGMPDGYTRVTLTAVALLLTPSYADAALALLRLPPRKFWAAYIRDICERTARAHMDAFINLVFLVHQGFLMADAILRTLWRRFISRRHMLEWQTMAQAEAAGGKLDLMSAYLFFSPALALAAAFLLIRFEAGLTTAVALELWAIAPIVAYVLNGKPRSRRAEGRDDAPFLRLIALSTWRYFTDFARAEDNWILPDNVQEDPPTLARRTSPTNMGLQLAAGLASYDLGYISHEQLASYLGKPLAAMERMERLRGHFYNWYGTESLGALEPRYVSTVDSGNLAASLIAVKQHCLNAIREPLMGPQIVDGLRDHCRRFIEAIPREERTASIMRLVNSLTRQLTFRPDGLFAWEGLLSELAEMARNLRKPVEAAIANLQRREDPAAGELRYWFGCFDERIRFAASELYGFAPWLEDPFETEMRSCAWNPHMQELNRMLNRVPALGELGSQYAAILNAVRRLMEDEAPIHPNTRAALEGLLPRLEHAAAHGAVLLETFRKCGETVSRWVDEMDFRFLFDRRRKLLHIGFHEAGNRLDSAYYDLLASEARSAVFVGIAKGDLPRESWFHLGRSLTWCHGQTTLVSWSGTLFEYLMPSLFMKTYENAVLGESLEGVVRAQIQHGRLNGTPWGVSEAACSLRNHAGDYQYQPFGVPELSANPGLSNDLVIAPYASMLAAMVDRAEAAANLRSMHAQGWTGRYGFYESADFTKRPGSDARPALVKAYMVHHQGMGLLAVCNTVLDGSVRERFHRDPMVQATEYLLQERLPALVDVTDEQQKITLEFRIPGRVTSAEQAA